MPEFLKASFVRNQPIARGLLLIVGCHGRRGCADSFSLFAVMSIMGELSIGILYSAAGLGTWWRHRFERDSSVTNPLPSRSG
jgi:hypothetical protein